MIALATRRAATDVGRRIGLVRRSNEAPVSASDLIAVTPEGLYCAAGGFYIDPPRAVARALVTHGHADHARPGHGAVLATPETLAIMAARYGVDHAGAVQPIGYGIPLRLGDVTVRFVPAGHVLGSAQIVIERGGFRLVISGDYKRQPDPTAVPFEPVRCHAFVSEATFGLPVFRHPPPVQETAKLLSSLARQPERVHLVGAYGLGKAQRLIALLREAGFDAPIGLHGAMVAITALYRDEGIALGPTLPLEPIRTARAPSPGIVICPPSAIDDRWSRRFDDPVTAFASGWMRIRARARQRGVDVPLILSDHADWPDLTRTIAETGCSELWVTHGQEDALCHWATGRGIAARPLRLIGYGDEAETG